MIDKCAICQKPTYFTFVSFYARNRIDEECPHPFVITAHRKIKLEPTSKTDPPAWKLIRPRRERTRDDDDFLPLPEGDRGGEFWVQLKSPFIAKDARRESWEIPADEEEEEDACVQSAWMHYKDYLESLDTLIQFHKPFTYENSTKNTNLERLGQAWEILGTQKRSALAGKMRPKLPEDRSYLFIDHLEPIRLIVGFAGLSRWRPIPEEPVDPLVVENRCRCGEDPEEEAEKRKLTSYEKFQRRRCGIPTEDHLTMISSLSARFHSWKLDRKFPLKFDVNSNEMKVGSCLFLGKTMNVRRGNRASCPHTICLRIF